MFIGEEKMIQRILGTINKRIDVGFNKATGNLFIHTSSNCPEFTREEVDSLLSVLTIANMLPYEHAGDFLSKKYIELWEPAPPPAEIKIV
jgi:hypothetical protein